MRLAYSRVSPDEFESFDASRSYAGLLARAAGAAPTTERLRAGKVYDRDRNRRGARWTSVAPRWSIDPQSGGCGEAFYGRFRCTRRDEVQPVAGRESVFNGVTWGRVPTLTRSPVGEHISQDGLNSDWVATHELSIWPSLPFHVPSLIEAGYPPTSAAGALTLETNHRRSVLARMIRDNAARAS